MKETAGRKRPKSCSISSGECSAATTKTNDSRVFSSNAMKINTTEFPAKLLSLILFTVSVVREQEKWETDEKLLNETEFFICRRFMLWLKHWCSWSLGSFISATLTWWLGRKCRNIWMSRSLSEGLSRHVSPVFHPVCWRSLWRSTCLTYVQKLIQSFTQLPAALTTGPGSAAAGGTTNHRVPEQNKTCL